MASIFAPTRRHAVPAFRRFAETVALGEVRSASQAGPRALAFDWPTIRQQWRESRSIALAGDVLGFALVSGKNEETEVKEAARFVLDSKDCSSAALIDVAERSLGRGATQDELGPLPRLATFLDEHSRSALRTRIGVLRSRLRRFQRDPILYTELARLFLILGEQAKAKRSIRVALELAPGNRYVLRSAARLYAHYDEPERALHILRKFYGTKHDPWLASAELAVAGILGSESRLMKAAMLLASSESLSPFSKAELNSGLGSVELMKGDRKRSRRLFRASLQQPNSNSLAQVEWALSKEALFDLDVSSFAVARNSEALALEAFADEDWGAVLTHCENWLLDMPFASRPIMMASHVATIVLDDYSSGQLFCRAGLVREPKNAQLLNNLAYALACEGRVHESLAALADVPTEVPETTRICVTATKGLALFRAGQIQAGRAQYDEAITAASRLKEPTFWQLAVLNYVREELIAGSEIPAETLELIEKMRLRDQISTIAVFRDKVIKMAHMKDGHVSDAGTARKIRDKVEG